MGTTRRHRARVLVVGLSAALALVGTVSGCGDRSSRTGDAGEQRSASSSDPAKQQADASRGRLVDARLVANQRARFCSKPTPRTVKQTIYDPVMTAKGGDVTIRSARAVGRGVHLVDAEGAVAKGNPKAVASGSSDTWPLESLSRLAEEQSRRPLSGMEVTSGQSVVPLWRISFEPDSRLRGLSVDYDAGGGATKTIFLPHDWTFSQDMKGC